MTWFLVATIALMGAILLTVSYISLSIFALSEAYRIEFEEMRGDVVLEEKE